MKANNPPAVDGRIKEFESNGTMARNWIKNMRGGMSAGNKDIYVVGDQKKEKEGALSDMPKFTPYNCGFFKQTISSKS